MRVKTKIISIFMCLCMALLSGCSQYYGGEPAVTPSNTLAAENMGAPVITEGNAANTSSYKEEKTFSDIFTTSPAEIAETASEATAVTVTTVTDKDEKTFPDVFTTSPAEIAETASETTAATVTTVTDTNPKTEIPVIAINNETIVKYDTALDKLKTKTKTPYLYNFNTVMSAGIDQDGDLVDTEALYGLTAYIDGMTVNVKAYNYTDEKLTVDFAGIYHLDRSNGAACKTTVTYDCNTISTKKFYNGLYRISVIFSNDYEVDLYFYVNGAETWLCNMNTVTDKTGNAYIARRQDLARILKEGNVTPENSLDVSGIYYPYYPFDETWRCDTQLWINLSNTLVDDTWSDSRKVFTFCEWLNNNIAYDNYRAKTLHHSRARYYEDYSGSQSTYELKVGVCLDYANLLVIMCRTHGIPATTIGSRSKDHVWNIVYINNRWIEIDITESNKYIVYGQDTTSWKSEQECSNYTPYSPIPNCQTAMPSDATANQYLQTGYKVY